MENYSEKYSKDLKDQITQDAEKPRGNFDRGSGRVLAGLIVIVIGSLLLGRRAGLDIPAWLFSWKMLLIGIGLFVGARHSFRGFGWMMPILVGSAFLVDDALPGVSFRDYIWPIIIIGFGLLMIIRPRHRPRRPHHYWTSPTSSTEDEIDATSIFGGTRKNIITKDFKGGDITTFFGGTDLNLMQADIQGTVVIDITQVFGGTKLLIPSHWQLKSEVVCVFGSIEDKRPQAKETPDPSKTLMLKGTCFFGGIDIKSY